jgi:hypothetical protein
MNFFGSEKFFKNRTPQSVHKLVNELETRTPTEWFMAPNNKKYLASQLLRYNIILDEIGLHSNMNNWAKKNKINNRYNADQNATGVNDYMVVLDSINSDFISHVREKNSYFDQPIQGQRNIIQYKNTPNLISDSNDYNIINGDSVIQDGVLQQTRYSDDREAYVMKKSSEMTADDIKNLDVYDPTYDRDLYAKTIGLAMKRSRRNNFQKNMHARHTDFETEGWRSKDEDMGSRDNLIRGFDMSDFKKYAINSKRPVSRDQFQYS